MAANETPTSRSTILSLLAAVLANGAAGLLYVWSLFILPMETSLALSRSDLGLVSSLALISFTAGVALMPAIMARIGRVALAGLAFALIAGGHIVFGVFSSWSMLTLAYGIGFGAGSGMAYGLALSLAAGLPLGIRAVGIGLALGAFALSGILLPLILGNWIAVTAPGQAFLRIGAVVLAVGVICIAVLSAISPVTTADAAERPPVRRLDMAFAIMSVIFFMLCFIGLAVVSQAAAIAATAGVEPAGGATTALTLGYLSGSLLGAPLAGRLGERPILLLVGVLALAGTAGMMSASPVLLMVGAALIGAAFGGSGSVVPVLLGLRYGAANISALYGRMIIAYGVAGLVAPGLAGMLYDQTGNYGALLGLCLGLGLLSLIAPLALGGSKGRQ